MTSKGDDRAQRKLDDGAARARGVRDFNSSKAKKAREAAGLTQQKAAKALTLKLDEIAADRDETYTTQVARVEISNMERSQSGVSPRRLIALASIYNVDPIELTDIDPTSPTMEQLRHLAGLTQVEMTVRLGANPTTRLYHLTIGREPRPKDNETVERLAQIVGTTPEEVEKAIRAGLTKT